MPVTEPDTFDEYRRHLGETLRGVSPRQRLAFVAVLAERALALYEEFSCKHGFGEPAALRPILAAVRDQLQGRALAPADRDRLAAAIDANAPDTEDFDERSAWQALQACMTLSAALECCSTTESAVPATKAALAVLEAAVGDWPGEAAGQRRAWKNAATQKEFAVQSALLQTIAETECFDDATLQRLKTGCAPERAPRRRAASPAKSRPVDEDSVEGWRWIVGRYLRRLPAHRTAFTGAMAERLLASYQAFLSATGKGEPDLPRIILDAVWQAAKGQPVSPGKLSEYQGLLKQAAPDAGEAGTWNAWSAWRVLELALACCGAADNHEFAAEAAVVAYERLAGRDARNDPQLWKTSRQRPDINGELGKQMLLMAAISTRAAFNDQNVAVYRKVTR